MRALLAGVNGRGITITIRLLFPFEIHFYSRVIKLLVNAWLCSTDKSRGGGGARLSATYWMYALGQTDKLMCRKTLRNKHTKKR